MKLYFSPGACSLSPHIVLCESGLPFEIEKVDLSTKRTAGDNDFREINPKGYVPALQLDSGLVLTEGPAIVQYVADLVPEKRLVPTAGSIERYQVMEMLNFISTEIHQSFSPLFRATTPNETKNAMRDRLTKRIAFVAQKIEKDGYATGAEFGVADAYLFTVLGWARHVKFDLSPWPAVVAYLEKIAARPAVLAAMKAEGLIKG